ncbi:MAG TPA: hypothetical protein PKD24_04970 [Pyrinomonadaceae bacterium]|nr:hypothetical protein [Pyrinomonadaceae bacterium]HMP64904.1 hypothetical protein [Pyrinomonadaceae bacterium]
MARQREPRQNKSLPPGKKESDDDVIIGEFVDRQLVSPQTIEKFAERDRDHEDFERFLQSVNNFVARQQELNREHATLHPDAIEGRKSQNFRRIQYVALIALLPFNLVALLFVPLPVASVLGIISILIVSGVLVNGRDREMDLNGFIRMIHSIAGGKEK